ncbi:lysophospholipase L1-like esterase [Rhizomicrobium palustre]|uniref:Lysophospholipase L1-like esterase n=1 Tax=Rhizomicrobium palustre TaxID=189966 RepID=A0A846MZE4_9PROT|nr:SGNH/GDSL hydrolase family protein [Rhizomicrobium palustre]NIK88307.1 lysophospholipase L1-like esterase [Rhizomicrobium palustre]
MRKTLALMLLTGTALTSAVAAAPKAQEPKAQEQWVTSWATSQMIAVGDNILPAADLTGATLRQSVRLSTGGKAFRLVLSNAFGSAPLHLPAVHVAKSLPGGGIDPSSDHVLTFGGHGDVTIPAGAAYVSDPVAMPVGPLSDIAISIRYDAAPAIETSHPGSRQTSYVLPGDHLSDAVVTGAKTVDHWYQIDRIEVLAPAKTKAVVALGDSITDGRGSTTNGNDRWTNVMAAAFQAQNATRHLGVLNSGIGGNCVLTQCLGPAALARLEREVFSPPGVESVIVYEGVNDLGGLTREKPATPEEHAALVARLISGFTQIAERAHAHGLKAYIATILPYGTNAYYHPDAANEADRAAVNGWIKSQKLFDGVIDFDAVMRDPSHPANLNPAYDTGDGLHPNASGYQVMGTFAAKALAAKTTKGKTK